MRKPLLAHEIGSLAKPNWRVKAITGRPLSDEDLEEARRWGEFLGVETDELLSILSRRKDFTKEEKDRIVYYSSLMAVKLLEKAGLDVVYDGEQHRVEMYEYPIKRIEGFTFYGHVRSFDNKYYRKAALTGPMKLKYPYHVEEFERINSFATKPVKIPLTGAYTLVDWSFDEYYMKDIEIGTRRGLEKRREARRQFIMDMAREVIYPNLKALYDAGARILQIDEPAATTKPAEVPDFVKGTVESVRDLKDKVFFAMHICFSDYSVLFPHIEGLQGIIHEMHFEYANRDSRETGRTEKERVGYEILRELARYDFIVGLGVIDVHTDFIEPPELVRDRILYALDIVKDPERLYVAPDCGLRTRTWDVAFQKLRNMVEGRNMALKEIGL